MVLLKNDTDAEGDALTASLITTTTNGILTFNADGSFTYVHDGTNTLFDSFTYQVNDGACDSNVATVTITITPINDCPVVLDDAYTVDEGGTLTKTALMVLLLMIPMRKVMHSLLLL